MWRLEKFLAAPGGLSFELEYAHGKGIEGRVVGDVNEVAVRLRDTDQTRNSQGALDLDERSRFLMGRSAILSRALAPRAEVLASRSNTECPRAGSRCFAAKLRELDVEHRARDLGAVLNMVPRKRQDIAGALDRYSGSCVGARKLN